MGHEEKTQQMWDRRRTAHLALSVPFTLHLVYRILTLLMNLQSVSLTVCGVNVLLQLAVQFELWDDPGAELGVLRRRCSSFCSTLQSTILQNGALVPMVTSSQITFREPQIAQFSERQMKVCAGVKNKLYFRPIQPCLVDRNNKNRSMVCGFLCSIGGCTQTLLLCLKALHGSIYGNQFFQTLAVT